MTVFGFGLDIVTLLRVATMLVFITAFAGIALWLLTPAGRRRAEAEASHILQEDDDVRRPEGRR